MTSPRHTGPVEDHTFLKAALPVDRALQVHLSVLVTLPTKYVVVSIFSLDAVIFHKVRNNIIRNIVDNFCVLSFKRSDKVDQHNLN